MRVGDQGRKGLFSDNPADALGVRLCDQEQQFQINNDYADVVGARRGNQGQ